MGVLGSSCTNMRSSLRSIPPVVFLYNADRQTYTQTQPKTLPTPRLSSAWVTRRALGRAHISTMQCLIHKNISSPINFWKFMEYIVFGPISQWWRITSKLNNPRIQMRIRIFTKIESIRPSDTPNLSTKFHPDPSTTFWDILHTNKQTNRQKGVKT